jgi:hypothetical protein
MSSVNAVDYVVIGLYALLMVVVVVNHGPWTLPRPCLSLDTSRRNNA